jgi:hypothetical protein
LCVCVCVCVCVVCVLYVERDGTWAEESVVVEQLVVSDNAVRVPLCI